MNASETWKMMAAVARRAMRMTQPPAPKRERAERSCARGPFLEDHYALLLAAGY
jgi:hypothetical protein